ncbi:hypothetical protein BAUCODRAFT_542910 [Baudoinia panamericana UAMH 10762]|uniref:Uncharacterized protein n=1 Tax=Baudoinia panamericana (strain UAMH 10762) TaxID=717646 RepID=M2LMF9_BAUPA|nr:uncharacterized protein BAUCODRAFT_542910 [Baudoinia panamericana UAMH 10762]EMC95487.1 hypothetical protein BAUCODRAFT_542910 [Baudoinia panamericana UAMH 10762]
MDPSYAFFNYREVFDRELERLISATANAAFMRKTYALRNKRPHDGDDQIHLNGLQYTTEVDAPPVKKSSITVLSDSEKEAHSSLLASNKIDARAMSISSTAPRQSLGASAVIEQHMHPSRRAMLTRGDRGLPAQSSRTALACVKQQEGPVPACGVSLDTSVPSLDATLFIPPREPN